ncbi:quinone oxidoreductase family protein [Solirhodobacter olei]|uniref:quinone oxidoreductase family protein n=1 Tax=Solirhodobacter olei TaxID=2493082 RepID=UPI000FD7C095|nr:quinone oxidoreductase [Solirhodobacter olei]
MATAKTVIIEETGGPEKLKIVDRPLGTPGPGEILIRHNAIGLNFIEVYQRTGLYKNPLPLTMGMEASGVVEAVGEGVTHLKPGDRAAYAANPPGAYCEARVMPAVHVMPLPDAISFEEGAAMMLKGLTVVYLFERITPIARGEVVLMQAAAGGVGLIGCQWARSEGITLIGTAGSKEKCDLALANGAAHAINYRTEDFAARVREITGGEGVHVVMDSVGRDTFDGSLSCLRPFGFMMLFGASSGPVPLFDLGRLAAGGSLKITRPSLFNYIARHEDCMSMSQRLFEKVASGQVKIDIGQSFPLEEVAEAHRALEARATTGSTILTL